MYYWNFIDVNMHAVKIDKRYSTTELMPYLYKSFIIFMLIQYFYCLKENLTTQTIFVTLDT